jgi:hypothetical protein
LRIALKLRKILRIIACVLVIVGAITWFPTMFTQIEGREINKKYDGIQAPLYGATNLIVDDDTLFCYTTGSDCIIAFNLDGSAKYSIYLEPSDSEGSPMAIDNTHTLVVPIPSAGGLLLFKEGLYLRTVSEDDPEYKHYDSLILRDGVVPRYTVDKAGVRYSIGFFGTSINRTDTGENLATIVSNPLHYKLLALPIPGMIYIIVGSILLFLLNRQEKRERRDDIYLGPNER